MILTIHDRYLPDGYTAVGALALQTPVNIELPPPHFTKPTPKIELEESDITDLAKALEKMSVHSPIQPQDNNGNVEPNLKPVDVKFSSPKPKEVSCESTQPPHQQQPQQQPQQFTYFVTKPTLHERNFLPSLYFEAAIGFFSREIELSDR